MRQEEKESSFDRRQFIGTAAVAAAALAACSKAPSQGQATGQKLQPGPEVAPDGPVLKAGLVGCGGRGSGAVLNFLQAGPNLKLTALADVFPDRIDSCRKKLRDRKTGRHELSRADAEVEVPDENCFVGFDACQKLIDSGVDIVLLATPPHFRPEHFEAAVSARKHVFMEKPVAVDPVGVRSITKTAEKADAFGLTVTTGTQYRHQKKRIETYNRIADGAIGDIVAARCYSLRRQLWYRTREKGWSDMEYMIRDWVNWTWLSGDFIVEQHIHGLDIINWFTNSRPAKALATGARMRRVTGDQYDFFNVDYEMESGIHVHSMSRQINGCTNNISRWVMGTKGYSDCEGTIFGLDGKVLWEYGDDSQDNSPYVQEHIDMVTAIRTGERFNDAYKTATSTLTAVMARISAYTGLEVAWDEVAGSDMRLGPNEYAMGPVPIETTVPVPGTVERA